MRFTTRRHFLATTSAAVAGTAMVVPATAAQPLSARIGLSSQPARVFLPEPTSAVDLQTLAKSAIDAATSAGASYADIRIAERNWLNLMLWSQFPIMPNTRIGATGDYGIRVIVDGTWAFGYGAELTRDSVAAVARRAVTAARAYAQQTTQRVELIPMPVVTGEWTTPYRIDPFDVPLQDQAALLGAYRAAALRVRHGADLGSGASFDWTRETRVFVSSEGSSVTQILRRSQPRAGGSGNLGMGDRGLGVVMLNVPHYAASSGGYETVAIPGLQDEIKKVTEEAVRLATLPRRVLEVGRYPVIFDGRTLGSAFGRTIGPALELDRVLEEEADASGTSYLSPPSDLLGTSIVSALLTVKAHRALPTPVAAKWDDEGVESQPYTVIQDGHLLDYHTSRSTTTSLRAWYEKQGRPVRAHGCAVAPEAGFPVLIRSPHLDIAPGTTTASMDDLIKEVKKGLLIREGSFFETDQQFSSGSLSHSGQCFEIENGKIVRRVEDLGLQFGTRAFWKSLIALGDTTTLTNTSFELDKGQPWRRALQSTTAPAGLFKEVNVISTKISV